MTIDISTCMQVFVAKRRLFQSEAQFQFELAWHIQEMYPDYKVYLEVLTATRKDTAVKNNTAYSKKRAYTDIVVFDSDGNYIAIELKYKTAKGNYENNSINLLNHGATDFGRFDFLYDIWRIEQLKQNNIQQYNFKFDSTKFAGGYAIFLTNEKKYWEDSKEEKKDFLYRDFCISGKDCIEKDIPLKWNKNPKKPECCVNGTFRDIELTFIQKYDFKWQPYYNDGANPEFMYLIEEIK